MTFSHKKFKEKTALLNFILILWAVTILAIFSVELTWLMAILIGVGVVWTYLVYAGTNSEDTIHNETKK